MNVRNLDSIKKDDDIFFYLGIPISKNYFSKERVAEVCDKLNGIKYQLFQESTISKIRMKKTITGLYPIMNNPNIFLFCSISKELYLGLYNNDTKIFLPATDVLLKKMNDTCIYEFANIMNKTAKRIQSELITETMCKDMEILSSWKKYIEQKKKKRKWKVGSEKV